MESESHVGLALLFYINGMMCCLLDVACYNSLKWERKSNERMEYVNLFNRLNNVSIKLYSTNNSLSTPF